MSGVKITAFIIFFTAALGAGIPFISDIWISVDSADSVSADKWNSSVVVEVAAFIIFGLLIGISVIWIDRKKSPTEPVPVSLTSKKRMPIPWMGFAFLIVSCTAATFFCFWALIAGSSTKGTMIFTYLAAIVVFGAAMLHFLWQCLHHLFEAGGATVNGDGIRVSYVHLGERQFRLNRPQVRKKKISIKRPVGSEQMWRVRFAGWRLAVLPMNWENPSEPIALDSAQ